MEVESVERIVQDNYSAVLRKGPYFAGWKPCSINDIEEYQPCLMDCSVPETNSSPDDTWYIPEQWGVDNSAYTWRRDKQLKRGFESRFKLFTNKNFFTGLSCMAVVMLYFILK